MYADFEAILEPIQEQGLKGPATADRGAGYKHQQGFAIGVPGVCTLPGGGDPNEPYAEGAGPSGAYTTKVNQHIPSGWCVYSKFSYGEVKDPLKLYRGKDCVEKFCNHIKEEAHRLYQMFPEKPMDALTKKQWKRYKRASRCHICFKLFNSKDPKVRDHCHYLAATEVLPTHYAI